MRLAEQLQPPTLTAAQLISGEERQERIDYAYEVAHNEAMAGRGEFWNDCHQSIYDAVREAMQCALTPELFKATVWLAVCEEAEKYAHAVAEDTD